MMVRSCSRLSACRCWALSQAMCHLTAMLMSHLSLGQRMWAELSTGQSLQCFMNFVDSSSRYCRKEECIGATSWSKDRTATAIPTLLLGWVLLFLSLLLVELLTEVILSREMYESGHLGNVTGCTLSYQPFLLFLDLMGGLRNYQISMSSWPQS